MTLFRDSLISPDEVPYNSVYAESVSQQFALGAKLTLKDGRVFRYAKNGAVALGAGKGVAPPARVANHTNIAVGGTADAGQNDVVVVTTLSTTLSANQYVGGWFLVNDATGEGQVYKIASHTASTTPTITLETPLVTALASGSEFTLVPNNFYNVVVSPTTVASPTVGIPLIAVTASYYFWAQVQGPAPVLVDTGDTVVIGAPVSIPAGTAAVAGACGVPANDGTDQIVGNVLVVNAATEYALIDLNLP